MDVSTQLHRCDSEMEKGCHQRNTRVHLVKGAMAMAMAMAMENLIRKFYPPTECGLHGKLKAEGASGHFIVGLIVSESSVT